MKRLGNKRVLDGRLVILLISIIPISIVLVIFGGYMAQIHWKNGVGSEMEIIIKPSQR